MGEEKLRKAINFFREFKHKRDRRVYQDQFLKFCQMVEDFLDLKKEEVFGDVIKK